MYDDKNYHEGDYIKDTAGNLWAKKEHFYSYKGPIDPGFKTKKEYDDYKKVKRLEHLGEPKTGIMWSDVRAYVKQYTKEEKAKNYKAFRRESDTYASEGYQAGTVERLPSSNSMSTSNHIGGDAIDISSGGFLFKTDAINDLIALRFGLIRDGGKTEGWHFEMTGVEVIKENEKFLKKTETKK
jgi:hypothetical protein